jgi:hypothetical protein
LVTVAVSVSVSVSVTVTVDVGSPGRPVRMVLGVSVACPRTALSMSSRAMSAMYLV